MSETHHSMKVVTRKTGLTPHVIRVWERRYGAVTPNRTESNRRLYSDADIARLVLLHRATQAGHSIGTIAKLADERLATLAAEAPVEASPAAPKPQGSSAETFIAEALEALTELKTRELEEVLDRALVTLGQHGLLERVIGPLARQIGELWHEGSLTAAHEHFATAVIRNFLARTARTFASSEQAPTLVVGTPAGQLHELGAVMVAAAASDAGWRTVYLGPSLPAAEIAGAAIQNQARAVALSIVYPEDDPQLPAELENLRKFLPVSTRILAGGRAAEAYSATLTRIGAIRSSTLKDLYLVLDALRASPNGAK